MQNCKPACGKIGDSLADIWNISFGGLHAYAEKKAIKRVHAIEVFQKTLIENVCAIPNGSIKEPPLNIVGPAMDAMKYCFETEPLADMFATLIASSMNEEKVDIVHRSFVEILKQMDAFVAYNFSMFSNLWVPTARYEAVFSNRETSVFIYDFIANGKPEHNLKRVGVSISCLERLGLISIERNSSRTEQHNEFYSEKNTSAIKGELKADPDFKSLNVICGRAILTPVGKCMYETCIENT